MKWNTKGWRLLLCGLCVIGTSTIVPRLVAEEHTIALSKVPSVVMDVFRRVVGEQELVVESESDHGVTTYEAIWKDEGTTNEVCVTEAGHMIETSRSISVNALPPAVAAAAQRAAAEHGELVFEMKTIVVYEMETKDESVELAFTADGRSFPFEEDDEDEDADDDGDDSDDEDE